MRPCPSMKIVAPPFKPGLIARYRFERYAGLPVEIDVASEFRYRDVPLDAGNLAILVSQSGETANTLASLEFAKARGQRALSVVNVPSSTMARASQIVLPMLAGPELGVASAKAFTCQLATLACLAIAAGREGQGYRRRPARFRWCREDTVSRIDLAPLGVGASQVKIGTNKGRAAKSGANAACLRRLAGDRLIDGRSNPGGIGTVIRKPTCQRSDKVAVALEPQYLKARQATLAEARPIILDGALLRVIHRSLRGISSNIARNIGFVR
jgi:hypothetical protein